MQHVNTIGVFALQNDSFFFFLRSIAKNKLIKILLINYIFVVVNK